LPIIFASRCPLPKSPKHTQYLRPKRCRHKIAEIGQEDDFFKPRSDPGQETCLKNHSGCELEAIAGPRSGISRAAYEDFEAKASQGPSEKPPETPSVVSEASQACQRLRSTHTKFPEEKNHQKKKPAPPPSEPDSQAAQELADQQPEPESLDTPKQKIKPNTPQKVDSPSPKILKKKKPAPIPEPEPEPEQEETKPEPEPEPQQEEEEEEQPNPPQKVDLPSPKIRRRKSRRQFQNQSQSYSRRKKGRTARGR